MVSGKSHLLAVRRALAFAAIAALLVVSIETASARSYPCWMIRAYAATHTRAEMDEMARKYKITPAERRAAMKCLKVDTDG